MSYFAWDKRRLYAYMYSGMLEFPGQVFDLNMPDVSGVKGPPVGPHIDGKCYSKFAKFESLLYMFYIMNS